ncbi:4114_t:CDS:2, partial [Cetraspora pellucida]
MKVCCDRQVSVTIDRSSQPDPSKLSKAGYGKIAHSGKSLTYNKKVEK